MKQRQQCTLTLEPWWEGEINPTTGGQAEDPLCQGRGERLKRDLLGFMEELSPRDGFLSEANLTKPVAELLATNGNAFVFGLLADQSMRSEDAWSLPYRLLNRIGNIDVGHLGTLGVPALKRAIEEKPALHRYPLKMAQMLVGAAVLINQKYDGDASKIWTSSRDPQIVKEHLLEFKGMGPKKASLGLLLLNKELHVGFDEMSAMDIACDVHVRRVFWRTGLVDVTSSEEIVRAARGLFAPWPAGLTTPVWIIGRNWCNSHIPTCSECVLRTGCLKRVDLSPK